MWSIRDRGQRSQKHGDNRPFPWPTPSWILYYHINELSVSFNMLPTFHRVKLRTLSISFCISDLCALPFILKVLDHTLCFQNIFFGIDQILILRVSMDHSMAFSIKKKMVVFTDISL